MRPTGTTAIHFFAEEFEDFGAADEDTVIRDTFDQLAEEFIKRLPGVCRHPNEREAVRPPKALGGM